MDDLRDAHVRIKLTRAKVACRRCRRLRTKCVHQNGRAPCDGCQKAGPQEADSCYFPERGHSRHDREYRITKSQKHRATAQRRITEVEDADMTRFGSVYDPSVPERTILSPVSSPVSSDPIVSFSAAKATWDVLPPHNELVEGCKVFWTSCLQVGFIPKRLFLERLSKSRESMSLFLILSILSVSSRFAPSLIHRYGSCQSAADYFIKHASSLVFDIFYEPTLENIQGFFLLSLAQWGNGDKTRSSMHMGVAVRMAGVLRLHREETYSLSDHASTDDIVQSEMARRTFWVIETEDNLHSGHASPAPFSPDDITALLPSEENDFAFGRIPRERAALSGTKAAQQNPHLISLPSQSLFATLLQAHSLWGNVARKACRTDFSNSKVPLWDETSDFCRMINTLKEWEAGIPEEHKWSMWNLRGHSAETVHLAYLSIVMVTRLNNIVIRRIYLDDIISSVMAPERDVAPPDFWRTVSDELFTNVSNLLEPIDTFISNRSEHEGFSAILLFSLYVCGKLSVELLKIPLLCPRFAPRAEVILKRSLEILTNLQHAWPLASRWIDALRKCAVSLPSGDGRNGNTLIIASDQEVPRVGPHLQRELSCNLGSQHGSENGSQVCTSAGPTASNHNHDTNTGNPEFLSDLAISAQRQQVENHCKPHGPTQGASIPGSGGQGSTFSSLHGLADDHDLGGDDDCFETELTDFLLGCTHCGMMNDLVRERFGLMAE